MNIEAIVTDIEGTTSSIDFVHQVLFPYSTKTLPQYVRDCAELPEIAKIIEEVRQEVNLPDASLDRVIEILLNWIKEDRKITPLKTLQGFIWEHGFQNGEFKSHLYEDAYRNLQCWHQKNLKLFVFSSGSVKAQKVLFGNSDYGDLTYLFDDYFDTNIGNKKEIDAYQNIAYKIKIEPSKILFLSDVIAELDAAKAAGYQTILLARQTNSQVRSNHQVVSNFDEIVI
jgi:enolase-phosphatase E1